MKLHIWTDRFSYLAVAHADSVSEARELLLKESDLGESGDGSCPERDKARHAILSETSAVYVGRVAEFSLSDNAQLREQEDHSEKLHQQIAIRDRRITQLEAENSRLRAALDRNLQGFRNLIEARRILGSDRYGALTREEIEQEMGLIEAALAGKEQDNG